MLRARGHALQRQPGLPNATPGGEPFQDAHQGRLLLRREADEREAALVAEEPLARWALLGTDDVAPDDPGRDDQRPGRGWKFEGAAQAWTEKVEVLDAGSGEAEIEKPNVQAWACSGREAPDYGDANCLAPLQ